MSFQALSNFDIEDYYKGVKQFGGVYSRNQLPKKMQNKCYIINMQASTDGNGTHWVAVMNVHPQETVYFNSMGQDDAPLDIEKFMKHKNNKKIVRNVHDLQALETSSCGQFCIYFINNALLGRTFDETVHDFTNNPVINEHLLKLYFGDEAFTESSLNESIKRHKVKGKGLRDIKKYYDRLKGFVLGPRRSAPPQVREFVEKFGSNQIRYVKVCRKPIASVIEKLASTLSLGKYDRNKLQLGYDKMFHLYMIIHFTNGQTIRLEKNQVVQIHTDQWDQSAEEIDMPQPRMLTFSQFIQNAVDLVDPKRLWVYHPVQSNCQIFCIDMLQSSKLLTPQARQFILQDAAAVLNKLGILQKIAESATNLAGRADRLINGDGYSYGNHLFSSKV